MTDDLDSADPELLAQLGVKRLPVPVPFPQAGGPANMYLVDNADGSLTLFDAGLGTEEAMAAIRRGFEHLGRRLEEVREVVVSHGHIDHYGAAQMFVEAGGAKVWVHPADNEKVTGPGRWAERDTVAYGSYLRNLGLTDKQIDTLRALSGTTREFARACEKVEHLANGQQFHFRCFRGEILYMPGHTPGLVCMLDREHRVLFSADHLLATVSPNPLIDLGPEGERDKFRALAAYLASARNARALDVEWVLPGHGPPFTGHRGVIDNLLRFYARRQKKILDALDAGPKRVLDLIPALFARMPLGEMFLALSELVGNLEVLEDQGSVEREQRDGAYWYRKAGALPAS